MKQGSNCVLLSGALLMTLAACSPDAASVDVARDTPGTRSSATASIHRNASATGPRSPIGAGAVEAAIAGTLEAHYAGGYDETNRCWRTERGDGDESVAYCMRLLPTQVVRDGGTTWLYVALASASDIRGNPDYLYGHVDAGAMDAFKLRIAADGTSQVEASGLGLTFGSSGDCGCANAQFVQVGPQKHGWLFSPGATWQGTTVASHALVVAVGETFKDVAALPRYAEEDPAIEYRLTIVPSTSGEWYPLRLTQWRDGKQIQETRIRFDPAAAQYKAPEEIR